jgi:hypothetical protein
MHQAEDTAGGEAVVDEEVLVDVESRVLALAFDRTVDIEILVARLYMLHPPGVSPF